MWLLPIGLGIVLGAPVGARVTHRYSALTAVRIGLLVEVAAIAYLALRISPLA